jgi:predicted transcriptional regulator
MSTEITMKDVETAIKVLEKYLDLVERAEKVGRRLSIYQRRYGPDIFSPERMIGQVIAQSMAQTMAQRAAVAAPPSATEEGEELTEEELKRIREITAKLTEEEKAKEAKAPVKLNVPT